MKKSKIFLYFSLIFLVLFSITNVNASDNVKIKSVELVDKSVNTTETSKATFDGLEMNFNIRFLSVDDYAKYKVVVENKENKDYEISVDSEFNTSKYITYEYEKANNIKANSESEVYVTVKYKNKVDDSNLVNGKYIENNNAVLKLSSNGVSNPSTSNNIILIIISLMIIVVVLYILFKNKKSRKISVFVLLGLLSMPLFVNAVEQLKLTVNSNVSIEKGYHVDFEYDKYIKASEADDYNMSNAYCYGSVYEGSISEENKYLYCTNVAYKGKKLYAAGDNVNVSDIDTPIITDFDLGDCKYDDGTAWSSWNDSKDVICPLHEKIDTDTVIDAYMYSSDYNVDYGYEVNESDYSVMNFMNVDDNWENSKEIYINKNTSFTMPSHDVLFVFKSRLQ